MLKLWKRSRNSWVTVQSVGICVCVCCEFRPGVEVQRSSVVVRQVRGGFTGLQVQILKYVDFPLYTDLHREIKHSSTLLLYWTVCRAGDVTSCVYLSRWSLQRVVVEDDGLQLCEAAVADGDGGHFITGEVQTHQRQLRQLWTHTT